MKIQNFVNEGANVSVTVSSLDLKEFAMYLIEQAKEIAKDESYYEEYLTADEVADIIGVSKNTLWRWEKEHYLMPFRIGRKARYKASEVRALTNGTTNTNKAATAHVTTKSGRAHDVQG